MCACQNGHRAVAELLLDRDADVGQARQDGTTALMYACQNGHRDVANLLLDRGADVGRIRPDGVTALMAARYAGHDDMAELLLSRGADGNEDGGPGTQPSPPRVSADAPHRAELGSRRLAVRTST